MTEATKAERLTVASWAREMGFERSVKALTGEDCDKLREALVARRTAKARVSEWAQKEGEAQTIILSFVERLTAINKAATT